MVGKGGVHTICLYVFAGGKGGGGGAREGGTVEGMRREQGE